MPDSLGAGRDVGLGLWWQRERAEGRPHRSCRAPGWGLDLAGQERAKAEAGCGCGQRQGCLLPKPHHALRRCQAAVSTGRVTTGHGRAEPSSPPGQPPCPAADRI